MDKDIIMNLSWNNSIENQVKAIDEIALMDDINPKCLLQPISKEYWENAAKVLQKIRYPKIEEAIPGLFVWLQDMNWPGTMVVVEILEALPKDVFAKFLEDAVIDALKTKDEIWLSNLAILLESSNLKRDDFVSNEVYLALLNAGRLGVKEL